MKVEDLQRYFGFDGSGNIVMLEGKSLAGEVADESITFAKLQNIPTDTLIGRDAGGTGDATSIALNVTLSMDGSNNLQRAALTGDVTASAGSNSTTIPNDTITYAKMQNVSAASKLLGRGDSGSGDPQEITLGTNLSITGTTLNATGGSGNVATDTIWDAKGDLAVGTGADTASKLTVGANDTFLVADNAQSTGVKWANASTSRTALGLGTIATQNASAVAITGGTITADNGGKLAIKDTASNNTLAFDVGEDLTLDRVLTVVVNNANRTLTISGNATISGTNTGDQTITLTGDVTGSGTGSFATTIGANKVTLGMMATVATDSILGRATAGTGNVESLTALPFAYTGDVTRPADSNVTTIAAGAVTLTKQADVATSTVFYRKTAGTGSPEVQTLATLKTDLGLTGTNTGDQTSIVGITGTKAQFDTACSDGNFLYVGDVTQYTDEQAQDATGAMIDTTLEYVDATPLLRRAALTGDVTASAGSNATTIANNAVSFAKMADMNANRLVGRITSGVGDPEEVRVQGGIEFDGASSIQTSAFTGDVTKTAGGTTLTISGLDATKIGTGVVSNTEFGFLDGVTSSIQTQLNQSRAFALAMAMAF